MVVQVRDGGVPEAWLVRDDPQARTFYAEVGTQWTETYLCRVVSGPGLPQASLPIDPLEVAIATLRDELAEARRELSSLRRSRGEPA